MLSLHFPKYKNFISETLARKHSISYICHTNKDYSVVKTLGSLALLRGIFMLRSSKISLNASLVETREKTVHLLCHLLYILNDKVSIY